MKFILLLPAVLFFMGCASTGTGCGCSESSAAEAPTPATKDQVVHKSLPDKKVTLVMTSSSDLVVKALLDDAGLKYDIPKNLPKKPFAAKFKDAQWKEAFHQVIASSGYDYSFDEQGVLRVTAVLVKKAK